MGRIYIGLTLGISGFVLAILVLASAGPSTLSTTIASALPVWAVVGTLGALLVFVSDKGKGVYEYLIAYGVETSTISSTVLVAALVLAAIIQSITATATIIILVVQTGQIPVGFLEVLAVYTLPVVFSATAFMTIAGIVWSAVSSPRSGTNSPVGFAPTLGIAPVIIVSIGTNLVPSADAVWLIAGVVLGLLALVGVLVVLLSRGPVRERFLSTL